MKALLILIQEGKVGTGTEKGKNGYHLKNIGEIDLIFHVYVIDACARQKVSKIKAVARRTVHGQ